MSLRNQIEDSLKAAMRNKEAERLSTLRLINAAIKDRDIAMRGNSEEGGVTNEIVQQILAKMVKQRHESARAYEEGGRVELAEKERREIAIIEGFLPRPLSQDEVSAAVDTVIARIGASSIRDMGRVMAALKAEYPGRMDFAAVGPMVKSRLS